jgi:glycosyltransferase involved in cell wall biosynthesis
MCASRFVASTQGAAWPRRRTVVVHPGLHGLDVSPDRRRRAREALGLGEADRVVGMVARLQRWKRHDSVLRAVALLRGRGHNVHGLFVGGDAYDLEPAYQAELQGLAARLGIADAVTFTGQVREPDDHVAAMDVLVNASDAEPFGLSILEAMSAGVAVVAVDSGGPSEIIRNGRDGLLAARSDPALIAAQVERLLTSDALRAQIGEGGRRRFDARFSAERMASETIAGLERVAARARRRSSAAPPSR